MKTKIASLPATPPLVQMIRRVQIEPCKFQPRTNFSPEKQSELTESFRQYGFDPALSHLLLRAIPQKLRIEIDEVLAEFKGAKQPYRVERQREDESWEVLSRHETEDEAAEGLVAAARFEIVYGERRWRSATQLNLEYVPAVVQQLTDGEVLERQLVENLQRDELNALEEAGGYENMLKLRDGKGEPIYTVATIAERIGRSVKNVKERLLLLRLRGTEIGSAFVAGVIQWRHARALAKLPTADLREEVGSKVLHYQYGPAMPYGELEILIRDDYQRELRGAKFSTADSKLVPVKLNEAGERELGGACTDCPHNSKNIADYTGKIHMCVNPACYRLKEAAEHDKWRAEVTDEKARRIALPAAEAAGLWDHSKKHLAPATAYYDLSEPPPPHLVRTDFSDKPQPWKDLLKGQEIEILLVKDEAGTVHELVKKDVAVESAKAAGNDVFRKTEKVAKQIARSEAELAAEKLKSERDAILSEVQTAAVMGGFRGIKVLPDELWNWVIKVVLEAGRDLCSGKEEENLARRHGWKEGDDRFDIYLFKHFGKMEKSLRFGFLVEVCLAMVEKDEKTLKVWAKHLGVDLPAVKKSQIEKFKAADEAAAEKGEIESGLRWNKRREKVEDFAWNGQNVCEDPDVCTVTMPAKRTKVTATISLARSEKGWHYGHTCFPGVGKAYSFPVEKTGHAYSSRNLAVATCLKEIIKDLSVAGKEPVAVGRLESYLELCKEEKAPAKAKAAKKKA